VPLIPWPDRPVIVQPPEFPQTNPLPGHREEVNRPRPYKRPEAGEAGPEARGAPEEVVAKAVLEAVPKPVVKAVVNPARKAVAAVTAPAVAAAGQRRAGRHDQHTHRQGRRQEQNGTL
jgi:hypothetical protein